MTRISDSAPINRSINRPLSRKGFKLGEKIKTESVPLKTQEFKPQDKSVSVYEFLEMTFKALDQRFHKVIEEHENSIARLKEKSIPTRLEKVEKARKALEVHTVIYAFINKLTQLPEAKLTEIEAQILLEFPKLADIHSKRIRIHESLQALVHTLKEKRIELSAPFNALHDAKDYLYALIDSIPGNERPKQQYAPEERIVVRESLFQKKP